MLLLQMMCSNEICTEKHLHLPVQTAKRATQPHPEADSLSKSTLAPHDPAEVLPATIGNEDDSVAHQKDGSIIAELRLVFILLLSFILSYICIFLKIFCFRM